MKVRIRGDSVRFRLTQSEVSRLADGHSISQDTRFAHGGVLRSALIPADIEHLTARFDEQGLSVVAPRRTLMDWAQSQDVALECPQQSPPALLIEKDFACLVPRKGGEDDDTFEHPRAAK